MFTAVNVSMPTQTKVPLFDNKCNILPHMISINACINFLKHLQQYLNWFDVYSKTDANYIMKSFMCEVNESLAGRR